MSVEKSDEPIEEEQREYSSPACLMHEFEREASAAPITIYHNPACSKSRETLALIRASGIEPRIVKYLETPPTEADLLAIVHRLGIAPAELVRRGEALFREKYASQTLTDMQWLEAMAANPILIERPIVVRGSAAVLGRPPENVRRLLG